MLIAIVVGAIGAYMREYSHRRQFLLQRRLESQATRDPLTGLFNRRMFDHHLDTAVLQARRDGRSLALMALDVDHFKLYNDAYGHQAGDVALKRVSGLPSRLAVRPLDMAVRTGGEEMALILYDASPDAVAGICARLIRGIRDLGIVHTGSAGSGCLSVSAGCAMLEPHEPAESLYRRADDLLYQAKAAGRDCAVLEPALGGRVVRVHHTAFAQNP